MSQTVEKLITKLKELDFEEKQIKDLKNALLTKLKVYDQQLDQISTKRSLALKELEIIYSSDQSENDFQSLCSENSFYPKSSDIDSDEYTQKRKERSDSTGSDVEIKKVRNNKNQITNRLNSVEAVNSLDQKMVNKCIDEMANKVIREISGSDIRLKDELEKLSTDPIFQSFMKDIEKVNRKDSLTQTTPTLTSLCRSYSTDGNFKENIAPSTRVRRTASNRFKFDLQNISSNKSNPAVISQPTLVPSKLLKGKKFLSNLLSDKQTIDEKREKSFTEKVEITSKNFKQNMFFWEKKTNECLLQNKINSKVVSI